MSGEFKLDGIICHDGEEAEFSSLNGKAAVGEKANVVNKLLDGFLQKGKWSSINMSTTAERRAIGDR